MAEEGSDGGEGGEMPCQIGESVVAFTYPLTEGMIISRSITEEGRLELTLIVAPFRKRGQNWTRAAVTTRDAARLSKKPPVNFTFPIKNVEHLRAEAKRARGDPVWVYNTCVALDKEIAEEEVNSTESDDKAGLQQIKLSSLKKGGIKLLTEKKYDGFEERIEEVEQLNENLQKKETKPKSTHNDSSDSDYEAWKKFRKLHKKRKQKKNKSSRRKSAVSESSSSSSSSDSDSSRDTGQVREKGKSGLFTCPFHESDARGFKDVKCQIKGQTVIRKNVRLALHNLYTDSTTLTIFADALVAKANGSAYKPFASDAAWLQAYARNIDAILLASLSGPWKLWNEQFLDDMVTGFLELVVRVSPNKEYPACLDDSVRKWMKKRRLGANTKYGPVSYGMQHGTFSDSGIQIFQSNWQKSKERTFTKPAIPQITNKGPSPPPSGGEKKPGLNILWYGWNIPFLEITWIHWECLSLQLQSLYRRMLKWNTNSLTVPESMSALTKVVHKVSSKYSETEVKVVIANEVSVGKIALPETKPNIIPLLSILPEEDADWYVKEVNLITKDHKQWEKLSNFKVQLGMKMEEYILVIKKLMELQMVDIVPVEEVKVINGLQCVSKPDGKQRLIFDGRPVNSILIEPEKVQLPDFTLLTDWYVNKEECIRFGKLDIDNFYHRLGVPHWMKRYLGLPKVKAKWIGQGKGWVSPVCKTLPMGLSHAVFLAQRAHLNLLRNCSISKSINQRITKDNTMWILVYIDDVILAVKDNNGMEAERELNTYLDEILAAYKKAGLMVNQQKIERAKESITGLGCILSNKEKGIYLKQDKVRGVVAATKMVMKCERTNTKIVEMLLGHWVWFFLLSRPFYSIFFHTYRWLHKEEHQGQRVIWKSMKREFQLAILFIDLCTMKWGSIIDESLLATDASEQGAGACEIKITDALQWQLSEEGIQQLSVEEWEWETTLNKRWQRKEHINILEMRALIMAAVEWMEESQHLRTRWRILVDSKVVQGAIRKGRSSAYMLCCLLRRILTICLRMEITIAVWWISTQANPADVLSRVFLTNREEDIGECCEDSH